MANKRTGLKWMVGIFGVLLLLVGVLRFIVWQPYVISSNSMEPTLLTGDRILVNRIVYRSSGPARGDIVVFVYPKDPSRTFVKRVIAVEGERVELRGNQVFVNEQLVQEPYLKGGDYPPYGPETVPKDKVFVLGDNRRESEDSREWGLLPQSSLIGKAWLIYNPFSRANFL